MIKKSPAAHSVYNIGNATFVSPEFECSEMGVMYTPFLPGGLKHMDVSQYAEELKDVKAFHHCKILCQGRPDCVHFNLDLGRTCSLVGANANRNHPIFGSISGDPYCAKETIIGRASAFQDGTQRGSLSRMAALFSNLASVLGFVALGALVYTGVRTWRCVARGGYLDSDRPSDDDEANLCVVASVQATAPAPRTPQFLQRMVRVNAVPVRSEVPALLETDGEGDGTVDLTSDSATEV
jgi:hypothetical protein